MLIYQEIFCINERTCYSNFTKNLIIKIFRSQMLMISHTRAHLHTVCTCMHICDSLSGDLRYLKRQSLKIIFNNEQILNLYFWGITILIMQTLGTTNPGYFLDQSSLICPVIKSAHLELSWKFLLKNWSWLQFNYQISSSAPKVCSYGYKKRKIYICIYLYIDR